jgi:hypothetical protein
MTTSCHGISAFVGTLQGIEVVALAATGGSAAAALPRPLPASLWAARYSAPPAPLDPAGAESPCGSVGPWDEFVIAEVLVSRKLLRMCQAFLQ